jgi:predicted transcriptional regulator with HTH domain
MTDLTDTQRLVLAAALEREDRCIYPITAPIQGGAVATVARSLLKRGLVEEVPAAHGTKVWRNHDAGSPLTLRATELARSTLAPAHAPQRRRRMARNGENSAPAATTPPTKRGAAQAALLALLSRPEGATNAEIQEATGWQPHSVRGALSGLVKKKLGHDVSSTKEEHGRVYRIAS